MEGNREPPILHIPLLALRLRDVCTYFLGFHGLLQRVETHSIIESDHCLLASFCH